MGRDVLLVGCDGIEDGLYLHCPLSTMAFPVARMCELAWEFLERRMADPSAAPQYAVLEAKLEIRESSQTPLVRQATPSCRKKSPSTRPKKRPRRRALR